MQINASKIQPDAPRLDATLILNFRGKEHKNGSAYFLEVLIPGVYLLYLLCLSVFPSNLLSSLSFYYLNEGETTGFSALLFDGEYSLTLNTNATFHEYLCEGL